MKTFLVTFSIYVLAIAVGVKVTTDTLEAKTQSDCFNSGNPYSRACVYLSSRSKQMQELKDLEQDYNNILGCSTNLLDALKERDKKILLLELRLEEIGRV